MRIDVRFFASLIEPAGAASESIEIDAGLLGHGDQLNVMLLRDSVLQLLADAASVTVGR